MADGGADWPKLVSRRAQPQEVAANELRCLRPRNDTKTGGMSTALPFQTVRPNASSCCWPLQSVLHPNASLGRGRRRLAVRAYRVRTKETNSFSVRALLPSERVTLGRFSDFCEQTGEHFETAV